MNPEGKRAVITALRQVVLAGLILLGAWLVLFVIRGNIPATVIDQMNEEMIRSGAAIISYDSSSWDWSRSLFEDESVSEIIGQRLGITLRLIGLTGLLSLVFAAVFLSLGVLVSKMTQQPGWLARVRSVLRLVLVSSGASTPFFAAGTLFMVFLIPRLTPPSLSPGYWLEILLIAFFASLLPTWLLVQAGHGELANLSENNSGMTLAKRLSIRLVIRLLRLVGIIIIVTMSTGLGRLLVGGAGMRDFPLLFNVAWIFVIIVVLVKLSAGLIETAYDYFSHAESEMTKIEESPLRFAVPKGWLIFSLGLACVSILIAVVGPLLAPYGWNEIMLRNRLAPPGPGLILGADNLGRDILSRLLHGIRIDVLAGLAVAGIISVLATGWAMLAERVNKTGSWLKETLESLVMLPGEILRAFPWLVLLILLLSMVAGEKMLMVMVVVFTSLVLLPRATLMVLEAYRSSPEGMGWLQALMRVVPMVFIFSVAAGIMYISAVSCSGYGLPPPYPELGGMLSGAGRQYMMVAPWMAQWPSIVLALLLLVWVMAGDALLERLGFRSKALWLKLVE
ncbi:ABC transporter permease [Chloroflexota bacterium]